jgi:hypothetical protein
MEKQSQVSRSQLNADMLVHHHLHAAPPRSVIQSFATVITRRFQESMFVVMQHLPALPTTPLLGGEAVAVAAQPTPLRLKPPVSMIKFAQLFRQLR